MLSKGRDLSWITPFYSHRQCLMALWADVLASGITAAIALNASVPLKAPLDMVAVADDLHLVEPAMLAVTQAIASMRGALELA